MSFRSPSQIALMAMALAIAFLAHGVAPAQEQGWSSFEQRVRNGLEADYIVTESRRVTYFHPRQLKVDHISRLVDPFLDFLDAEFMPLPEDARFKVLISPNRNAHADNAETLFGRRDTNLGTFHPRENVLAMPALAGPGTITSMLVYPVMRASIPQAPQWARIAVATFFEKVYAYPDNDGKLVFQVGYHNPWRFLELSGCMERLDLEQIISNPRYVSGGSHYRLLGMFLWEQGKLKPLIARLRANDRRGWNNFLNAAFDRPFDEIVPLWKTYLTSVQEQWYGIRNIPHSQVFASRHEFDTIALKSTERGGWRDWFEWRVMRPMFIRPVCPINPPA
jgi:hypothetical protein